MLTVDILDSTGKKLFDFDLTVHGGAVTKLAHACDKQATIQLRGKRVVRLLYIKQELIDCIRNGYLSHLVPRLTALDPMTTFVTHDYYR